jgi:hypothetical protein
LPAAQLWCSSTSTRPRTASGSSAATFTPRTTRSSKPSADTSPAGVNPKQLAHTKRNSPRCRTSREPRFGRLCATSPHRLRNSRLNQFASRFTYTPFGGSLRRFTFLRQRFTVQGSLAAFTHGKAAGLRLPSSGSGSGSSALRGA